MGEHILNDKHSSLKEISSNGFQNSSLHIITFALYVLIWRYVSSRMTDKCLSHMTCISSDSNIYDIYLRAIIHYILSLDPLLNTTTNLTANTTINTSTSTTTSTTGERIQMYYFLLNVLA